MEEGPGEVESVQIGERTRGILVDPGTWFCCLPCTWLQANTSLHKASITVAMLLVTSLLVASPVLFLISGTPYADKVKFCRLNEGCGGPEEVCKSGACSAAASRIVNAIDFSANPCEDFYQFSCGRWDQHPLGLNQLQAQVHAELQQLLETTAQSGPFEKVGKFYNSCIRIRTRSFTPMMKLLQDLGGYMRTGESNLTWLIVRLLSVNGAPLFDLYLDQDLRNSSRLALFLDLPRRSGHTLRLFRSTPHKVLLYSRNEPHYERRKRHADESPAYIYLKDTLEEKRLLVMEQLLLSFLPSTLPQDQKAKEIQNILLFATMLSKIYPRAKDVVHRIQNNGSFREYNLKQLQENYGFVEWKYLMEKVFSTNITESDIVYVMVPTYLKKLTKTLSHFQTRIVHNALLIVFATDTLNELLNLPANIQERSSFCARVTVHVMSQAVSSLYMSQYTPVYLKHLGQRVQELLDNLKETLQSRMTDLQWLDAESRKAALAKVSSMNGHFLTWPQLWNMTFISTLLQDIHVDPDNFFNNVINRYRQLRNITVDFHKEHAVNKKWAYPFVVNAYYEVTLNSIVIPLAILTQPYFRTDVPGYMRYGSLGMVLSHELLHSLDMIGATYDASGSRTSWLTKNTTIKLEARLECIAKQYDDAFHREVNFRGSKVQIQFDWNITRNENMADISGLQIAYETWRTRHDDDQKLPDLDLSSQQLFFINAAQVYCIKITPEDYIIQVEKDFHTPAPERVNGIMMNSPAFAEAFTCPVGSKMNPARKCSAY